MKARVLYFTAPGEVQLRDEPVAEPRDGERLFMSRLQAISPGTERLMFSGTFPEGLEADPGMDGFEGRFGYPFRYGYINVCTDEEGSRYFAFKDHCTAFMADPGKLIRLPDTLSDREALLLPHTETAVSIIHDLNPRIGERILIIGAGILGSLTALILSMHHGCRVTISDPHPEKADWFRRTPGALYPPRFVTGSGTKPLAEAEFDSAVDCSGNPAGLQTCIDSVGTEGRVIAAGWFGDQIAPLNLGRAFHRKRITLISSQVSNLGAGLGPLWSKERRMAVAMEIISAISPIQLISHSFSFSNATDAFTLIGTTRESFGLVALEPHQSESTGIKE